MTHHQALSRTILLGAALLFCAITILMTIDTGPTGRATAGSRVNITNSIPVNCTVIAGAGYNTVSFPCLPTSIARDTIVNGSDLTAMYQYLPGEADAWKVYNPNLPSWVVSDLQTLTRRSGYVLILSAPRSFSISGLQVTSTEIPLVAGWNLVGYPSLTVRNASTAFSSIDNFTQARTYDNAGVTYLIYNNPGGGTLTIAEPGQGYWFNATQATSWTVTGS